MFKKQIEDASVGRYHKVSPFAKYESILKTIRGFFKLMGYLLRFI